jgi:hypothetical protein
MATNVDLIYTFSMMKHGLLNQLGTWVWLVIVSLTETISRFQITRLKLET